MFNGVGCKESMNSISFYHNKGDSSSKKNDNSSSAVKNTNNTSITSWKWWSPSNNGNKRYQCFAS